ncbi:MAG TPA: hypothetical protein VL651_07770 [Bacteroidia bacterium]|jgi:hypothetical protein|nr:hypothetical protein [Bacteroidia bacterium]
MIKRRICVLLFLLFTGVNVHAQWLDTLRNDLHGSKWPTACFDSRNSFISNRRAHIWGVKAGVEFNSRLEMGLGYNFHDQHLTKDFTYLNPYGNPETVVGALHLAYVSVYAKYVYYKTEKWKFSIMPVQLGFGRSSYVYPTERGNVKTDRSGIVTFEPGISVSYKIFWWFGVGGDFGYRYMLVNNPAITENFNSPIYTFYVIFYWGDIYKKLFPDTKLAKML